MHLIIVQIGPVVPNRKPVQCGRAVQRGNEWNSFAPVGKPVTATIKIPFHWVKLSRKRNF